MHALIIDDDHMNALVLQKLLENEDLSVSIIAHPGEIPETLPTLPVLRLVFLDLEMPGIDGYQVLDYLRVELGSTVPVVAYTVHISESVTAWHKGFDGFLGKPISRQDFPDNLRRLLQGERVWAAS